MTNSSGNIDLNLVSGIERFCLSWISFVEVDQADIARSQGVEDFPTLVFYKSEIPAVYEGNHSNITLNMWQACPKFWNHSPIWRDSKILEWLGTHEDTLWLTHFVWSGKNSVEFSGSSLGRFCSIR